MRKLVMCLILSGFSLAADSAFARNVWRECGIGGMIFRNTGWAAITSNIIWDLGTTATSSNVSSDDLCEGPTASAAGLVHETYANIEEEISAGKGAHLTSMLNMLGCDKNSHSEIISGLRTDLMQQMSQPSYTQNSNSQNAESFFNATMSRAQAAQCKAI